MLTGRVSCKSFSAAFTKKTRAGFSAGPDHFPYLINSGKHSFIFKLKLKDSLVCALAVALIYLFAFPAQAAAAAPWAELKAESQPLAFNTADGSGAKILEVAKDKERAKQAIEIEIRRQEEESKKKEAEEKAKQALINNLNRQNRRPDVTPPGDISQIILNATVKYGADANWMTRVAYCESRFNPNSRNSHSSASGLFQFINSTWQGTPQGQAGLSVFDPVANAEAAAWMYVNGRAGEWVCK